MGIKDLLGHFNKGSDWPTIDKFRKCSDLGKKQIDVCYLL
jgi:hypothetical protein